MRHLENALGWLILAVGLPCVLYAMTVGFQDQREPDLFPTHHDAGACATCRDNRLASVVHRDTGDDEPGFAGDGEATP